MRQPSYGSEEWFEWYSEDPEVVLRRVESGEIPVDSGIRAMVVDANRRGLTTHSCCDGHGNDFAYITFKPWVDPQAISDWYDDCGVAHVAITRNLRPLHMVTRAGLPVKMLLPEEQTSTAWWKLA